MPLRILLADGCRILRESLRGMLELQENYQVVGELTDSRAALQTLAYLKPDIVLMDISKDVSDGIEAVRQLTHFAMDVKIIVLSPHDDELCAREILSLDPDAYLSTESGLAELLHAIEMVSRGKKYLCTNISTILMNDYIRQLNPEEALRSFGLSFRQKQVLQLVAEGKTTKDISRTLDISEYTVENHRRKIMKKLNIRSVAELTKYAIREGITTV
ncbi:MAG: response regulator transcription factor [Deltaproteobacteria bacterium]|nr:response regulator transcription factor [Deltaproteobacteria bacterium]